MNRTDSAARPRWTPWRTIVAFGFVSLFADMVYEGMRSISGPFLGALGASALAVGVITGAGEALALVLRLFSGRLGDRAGWHWRLTLIGYALTAVCVPLLALAPFVGSAGLFLAATLILLERTGKAVRSPSKSALLAGMAQPVGRGRGFGVHKALDQIGAFSGPLLIAGVVALTGRLWLALALLVVPGVIAMMLLVQLQRRMPVDEPDGDGAPETVRGGAARPERGPRPPLPAAFQLFAAACALSTLGLATFGIISFALVEQEVVRAAAVPVLYAAAMAVGAVAALGTGQLYDRTGPAVLLVVPPLVALVPVLSFRDSLTPVLVGLACWALATGVSDSTVKALVADLVPRGSLGTAYGIFAAWLGVAALAGGGLAGALYQEHLPLLVGCVWICQAGALTLLVVVLRRRPSRVARTGQK